MTTYAVLVIGADAERPAKQIAADYGLVPRPITGGYELVPDPDDDDRDLDGLEPEERRRELNRRRQRRHYAALKARREPNARPNARDENLTRDLTRDLTRGGPELSDFPGDRYRPTPREVGGTGPDPLTRPNALEPNAPNAPNALGRGVHEAALDLLAGLEPELVLVPDPGELAASIDRHPSTGDDPPGKWSLPPMTDEQRDAGRRHVRELAEQLRGLRAGADG